ncbi:putative quinol monooxygenase [Iningainema tapete]|uniref:Antibiotic biosynthesis monooxygenase n=1 Tax=Iningainema tapete BLCC-T55 TaxID=2748662 RepID=A0A8J7BWV1_9CYAN|nr:antibiotic biosynthesis monooxygenase [Iningainema tapete]MBD2771648.1 antibiotic biosynthesis monooxygenase [Iningainema tapete BLCC-T55]
MDNRVTTIIVRFPVKSEKKEEFQIELGKLLERLRQEETFVEARIHHDLDNPNIIVFYETYSESRESFLKRVPKQLWFQAFLDQLPNLLQQERDVSWNERISTTP